MYRGAERSIDGLRLTWRVEDGTDWQTSLRMGLGVLRGYCDVDPGRGVADGVVVTREPRIDT